MLSEFVWLIVGLCFIAIPICGIIWESHEDK